MTVYNSTRSRERAERLVKLRDYLYANASPTRAVKMAEILKYLEDERYKATIKTVYSDLNTLKYFFGVETKYDGRQRGYLLLNPPFEPYELRSIVNSIQAATSPYEVSWNGDSFQIFTVRKSNDIFKKYVLQLSHMEQIETIPDKREGKEIAEKGLSGFGNKGHTSSFYIRTKFRADNIYTSDFIDKFGENVVITPMPYNYFIASIDEPLTPELYLWTKKFLSPRIEIIFPEDAESKLRQYFADISEGKQTVQPFFVLYQKICYNDIRIFQNTS